LSFIKTFFLALECAHVLFSKKKVLVFILSLLSTSAISQSTPEKKHQIIAGFLLQFTSFVEWPDNKNDYVNICIIGRDPFEDYIDKMILRKPVNRSGKKIIISRKKTGDDINTCNLIYTTAQSTTLEFWNSLPPDHSILLVSDFDDFTKLGGMISLYSENSRIRLEINIDNSKKSNLKISSQLLKLAKITHNKKTDKKQ